MDVRSPQAVEKLQFACADESNLSAVIALIPSRFGFDDKATYLGLRAVAFTPEQALSVLGLTLRDLANWYDEDPEMEDFELQHLPRLQKTCGPAILRSTFMRNMMLYHMQDAMLLNKALTGLDDMSKREYDMHANRRSFYSAANLNSLESALDVTKREREAAPNILQQFLVMSPGELHRYLAGPAGINNAD